jgi:hypothetical protein
MMKTTQPGVGEFSFVVGSSCVELFFPHKSLVGLHISGGIKKITRTFSASCSSETASTWRY